MGLISFYVDEVTVDFVETAHIIGRLKWKTYQSGNPGCECTIF